MLFNILSLFLAIFVSCGKDLENSENKVDHSENRESRARDVEISPDILRLELECEDPFSCSGNIGVVFLRDDLGNEKKCLGSLVAKNQFLTAASCLPRSMRIPNLDCTNDAFIVFPKTAFEPEVKVSCLKVLSSDENSYKEPALWKQDLAILELHESVERFIPKLSFGGVRENSRYLTWSVDQIDSSYHLLKKNECNFVFDTYLNPYSESGKSPMLVAKNCSYNENDIGAPIFDENGLLGIYSASVDNRTRTFLLTSGVLAQRNLGDFFHISNFTCVGVSKISDILLTSSTADTCRINNSVRDLDYKRAKIFKNLAVHKENIKKYKKELSSIKKIFQFEFKIFGNSLNNSFSAFPIKPICIYDSGSWIDEYRRGWRSIKNFAVESVEYPVWNFITKLDQNLRPVSAIIKGGLREFSIEFNPFDAHINNKSFGNIFYNYLGREVREDNELVEGICY